MLQRQAPAGQDSDRAISGPPLVQCWPSCETRTQITRFSSQRQILTVIIPPRRFTLSNSTITPASISHDTHTTNFWPNPAFREGRQGRRRGALSTWTIAQQLPMVLAHGISGPSTRSAANHTGSQHLLRTTGHRCVVRHAFQDLDRGGANRRAEKATSTPIPPSASGYL